MFTKLFRYIFIAMIGIVALGGAAQAEFPEKPITLIIPAGAGGALDLTARVMTSAMPSYLGAPMVVKLAPGAAGQIGTAEAARATGDGYTLLYSGDIIDQVGQLVKELPYDTNRDFVTVAQVNTQIFSIVVLKESPFKTLKDLMDFGRANPGKLKFAHSGDWGPAFLLGGSLLGLNGIEANYVAYRGGGPSMQALLAGDGDFTAQTESVITAQGDRVRVLVSAGTKRLFDDVPSAAELGFPDTYGVVRFAVFAPSATPPERLAKLRQAFAGLQGDKSYQKLMSRIGSNTEYVAGDVYDKDLRPQQIVYFRGLVNKLTGGQAR